MGNVLAQSKDHECGSSTDDNDPADARCRYKALVPKAMEKQTLDIGDVQGFDALLMTARLLVSPQSQSSNFAYCAVAVTCSCLDGRFFKLRLERDSFGIRIKRIGRNTAPRDNEFECIGWDRTATDTAEPGTAYGTNNGTSVDRGITTKELAQFLAHQAKRPFDWQSNEGRHFAYNFFCSVIKAYSGSFQEFTQEAYSSFREQAGWWLR